MDNPKRILVIQLKRAGDVIVTTPVLAALHKALPEAEIDFLVDKPFAPLLENNPALHRVHVYDRDAVWQTWQKLRAVRYDWILDFQSSPRSILAGLFTGAPIRAGYKVTFWGKLLNRSMRRPGGNISVTEGKMNLVRTLLPNIPAAGERKVFLAESEHAWAIQQIGDRGGGSGVFGLIPTHRAILATLACLVLCRRRPATCLRWSSGLAFLGSGEEGIVAAIQRQVPECWIVPKTSLRQMAALLALCKTVITNDNGPMHLASAVGTPTVTVYGPTNPTSWNPGGPRHRIVRTAGLSCLGCNLNACPFGHECMVQVTPEQMLAETQNIASVSGAA
jgi:ADP-heptose:LPS heptosyltransferase